MDFIAYIVISIFVFFIFIILISTFYIPFRNYLDKKRYIKENNNFSNKSYSKYENKKNKEKSYLFYFIPAIFLHVIILGYAFLFVEQPSKLKYVESKWAYPADRIKYKGYVKNGIKEHYWNFYNGNGTLGSRVYFLNGKRHGYVENYSDKGKLLSKGNYLHGEKHGKWEYYWSEGNLKSIGTYSQGFKVGVWVYKNLLGYRHEVIYETYGVYDNHLVEKEDIVVINVDNSDNIRILYDEAINFYQNKDFKTAFQFFLLLSNYDDKGAILYVERMYKEGIGVQKDPVQSRKWTERRKQL